MGDLEQVWRERVDWQKWSGLTVADYCRDARVSVASFYRWKRLLQGPKQSRRQRESTRRRKRQTSKAGERPSQFLPIVLRDHSPGVSSHSRKTTDCVSSIRLELPNGVIIHLNDDLDGQRLGDVIVAAGQIPNAVRSVTTDSRNQPEVPSC